MKILLIGGTGFIGRFVAEQLRQSSHQVTVFHRGRTKLPEATEEILGDRNFLQDINSSFAAPNLMLSSTLFSALRARLCSSWILSAALQPAWLRSAAWMFIAQSACFMALNPVS